MADGRSFDQRIRATGYLGGYLAENIAWGGGSLGTPRRIVGGWMNSSGHRANILNGVLRDSGIGVSPGTPQGGSGGTYVTTSAVPDRESTIAAIWMPQSCVRDVGRIGGAGHYDRGPAVAGVATGTWSPNSSRSESAKGPIGRSRRSPSRYTSTSSSQKATSPAIATASGSGCS